MNKEAVKKLVKECLIEILAEGFASGKPSPRSIPAKKKVEASSAKKPRTIFDQLDEIKSGQRSPKSSNLLNQKISESVRAVTNDPILQSILAETATTTLQEQMQHEQQVPRVPHIDPSSFYSQASTMPPRSAAKSVGQPSVFQQEEPDFEVPHSPASGLDISSLFGEATKNWGEVLERANKKLP